MASGEWPGSPAPKDNFQNGNRSIDGASSSSQGFWDRIESSIESDYDSITSSVESGFNSLSRGVTDLFPAGGLANLQISQYFYQKYESISLQAPQAFLQQVVDEIKNSTWTGLETVSNCVFGPTSIQVGIVYGLGESLVKDVWSLLGLAKLLCLANLYAHLDSHSLIAASDPVTWALANALDQIPAVHSEMKMAHDRVQEMWKELGEIVRHPGPFFSVVGKDISKEFKDDWKSFTIFCERPTLVHGFLLGKAVGRILYQLIMLLLVVEGAAKTAASIASKFPRLARIARVVEAGGRLADLEVPERMAAGGASAGEELVEATAKKQLPPKSAIPVPEESSYKGKVGSREIDLKGFKTEAISYTKRSPQEVATLRNQFNRSVRSDFLKKISTAPDSIDQLKQAGLSDEDIADMQGGSLPEGGKWQVHHKLPLDDSGTNDFSNLILIENDPYHKAITNAQRALTSGMNPGDTRSLDFPVPVGDGVVYPTFGNNPSE